VARVSSGERRVERGSVLRNHILLMLMPSCTSCRNTLAVRWPRRSSTSVALFHYIRCANACGKAAGRRPQQAVVGGEVKRE